ncbi:SDR family NAD(P)-dependent oxidoreductase [Breoghania sp. L-A4]|uniref:SDR family NAD(P)-dependent oxidoreductase n=1 Tax=Breoghania sp. L-A4 TaxID=2304600 RepID=UPI000E360B01|nr:SDR family NAD(P)-dependent oxidoreductase [Breoghania sp. L-A4]AXS40799.1 SDR family NAD(P)-dependent oxidoreductase [Breoghania sp. L-A4]
MAAPGHGPATLHLKRDGDGLTLSDAAGIAVRGRVVRPETPMALAPVEGGTDIDIDAAYENFRAAGMDYGPHFRVLRSLTITDSGFTATLEAPTDGTLTPALVDGALQAALGWMQQRHGVASAVPMSIGRIDWTGALPAKVTVSASITGAAQHATADIDLSGPDGTTVLSLRDVRLAAVDVFALVGRPQTLSYSTLALRENAGVACNARPLRLVPLPGADELAKAVSSHLPDAALSDTGILVLVLPETDTDALPLAVVERLRDALDDTASEPPAIWILHATDAPGARYRAGGFSGLLRSWARELGPCDVRSLEVIGEATEIAAALEAERALETPADPEIRWRDGTRFQRAETAVSPISAPTAPYSDGWVITGGLGGLGLLLADHLVSRGVASLALIGRTADTPSDAQAAAVEALRQRGATVLCLAADCADQAGLTAAVDAARKAFGTITGVVHAAGVTRDGLMAGKSSADIEAVLRPKILGAEILDAATAADPLEHFVLFSSITGSRGTLGQTDYGYANRVLDLFAEHRETLRARGERTGVSTAIAWPLWDGVGMQVDARTAARLRETLRTEAMPRALGLRAFDAALRIGGQVLPLIPIAEASPAVASAPRAAASSGNDSEDLLAHLRSVLSSETKIAPERLSADAAFDAYGVDSVMGIALVEALERDFGPLPKVLLFEHTTLNALRDHLLASKPAEVTALFSGVAREDTASAAPVVRAVAARAPSPSVSAEALLGDTPIAIIGFAGRFPGATDLETFAANLEAGHDAIGPIPKSRWDVDAQSGTADGKGRFGGFLDDVASFDPLIFGIAPKDARLMDPQARIFLEECLFALDDAGYSGAVRGSSTGVFAAAMWASTKCLPRASPRAQCRRRPLPRSPTASRTPSG